ncbi:MAG: UDP-N-acetylmuramoyl-L-alanine--D-glutamate ligase [Mycobacteriales bacterium]
MRMAGYRGRAVLIVGGGVSGLPAARVLLGLGARVTIADRRYAGGPPDGRARELADAGAALTGDLAEPPVGTELVITRPGARPDEPVLVAAAVAGIEVMCEVELAWRLRPAGQTWLAITGTNGKTTAVGMLESILHAAGSRAVAAGNIGYTTIEAVTSDPAYDVLAVELSSFQLHWSSTVSPAASAILNLAPDHMEWYDGDLAAYAADKARIFRPDAVDVYNADDQGVTALAARFPTTVGCTLGAPAAGQLGIVAGSLVDKAFIADPEGVVLASTGDVRPPGRHNIANALAAAALARAHGVPPVAIAAGLRDYQPGAHRNAYVATVSGVDYVDDSKATNPHAAAASLAAYPRIVWIAGGQLKNTDVDPLVARFADRLAGAVVLGIDRQQIADAIVRHAPDLRVVDVANRDDGAMSIAVRKAAGLATRGDTVLLAPAAASLDMFASYAARGDAFIAAVSAIRSVAR